MMDKTIEKRRKGMDGLLIYWFLFLLSGAVIIFSGTRLSITADEIAIRTGWSRVFIGSILLALSTSLPELVTISSAAFFQAPDLALGNVFGSYTFNFLLLVVIDLYHGRGPLMLDTGMENLLLAFFGILLATASIFFIIYYQITPLGPSFPVGWESGILLLIYLSSSRLLYRYQKKNRPLKEEDPSPHPSIKPLPILIYRFSTATLLILLSGITIAWTGEILAENTGWGQSLIGTLFIAFSTSLPELITTLTAVKMAAYDLAVGNILGSNIINVMMIAPADLLYRGGPILKEVSIIHAGTASLGIGLTIITAIGLFYRSKKTIFGFWGWDTAAIFLLYVLSIYLLFF